MTGPTGTSFDWDPVIAFLMVGVLALILRWAWSSRRTTLLSGRTRIGSETDYGLLIPIAAPRDLAIGRRMAARLDAIGVRNTLATTASGLRLMVFPDDAQRARDALPDETG